ncbi:hypothetical protein [Streptomyces sp. NPDC001205]
MSVQRIRLRIAGRITPVLGVLFMLLAPAIATAPAAAAVPSAVRAPAAPTPTPSPSKSQNPCDLIPKELPSREWCEKGAKGQHPDPPGGPLPENPLDALKGDCKSGPIPEVPGDGLLGWIDSGPKVAPPARDPKAPDADAYLYEQYGFAGLRFNTYDLGCAGGLLKDPSSASDNWFANKVFTWSKAWTAFTVVLREQATDGGFLKDLNPVIEKATRAVRDAVYTPWVGTSIVILGAALIFQARRRDTNSVMSQAIWALIVMTIATGVASYPVEASSFADNTMDSVIAQVDQSFAKVDLATTHTKTPSSLPTGSASSVTPAFDPDSRLPKGGTGGTAPKAVDSATAHGNMLVHSTLYQYWLRGTLGSTTSPVARKYGAQLFDAQALTWAESRSPDRDKIAASKQKKFEQLAASIKDEDPTAYDHLTGRADGRLGGAFLSMFSAFATNLFSMLANLVIIGGKLTIKFTVVLFPALAVIGLHRRTDGTVKTALHSIAAACINVPLFAVAGGIDVVAVEALSVGNTNLPAWLSIVLLLMITWILWRMTKPLRRMSAMVNPNHNYMSDAGSAFTAPGRFATTAGKYWLMSRALKKLRGGHPGSDGDAAEDLVEAAGAGTEQGWQGGRPGPMPLDDDYGSWWDTSQGKPKPPNSPSGAGGSRPQHMDGTLQSYADYQADTGMEDHRYATGHDRQFTAGKVDGAAQGPTALDSVWDADAWYVDDLDPAATPALPPASSSGGRGASFDGGSLPAGGPQPQGPTPLPGAPSVNGHSTQVPSPRSQGRLPGAPSQPGLPAPDGAAPMPAPEGDQPYRQEDPGPQVVPPALDPDSDGVYVIYRPDQGYAVQDDTATNRPEDGEQR